jgi:hypothetical protein
MGTQVTGTLTFSGFGSTNYYNPVNGFVPAGPSYLNSGGPTVTLGSETAATLADFGFADLYDTITATFTSNGLVVTDNGTGGNAWIQTFTDTAFLNASIAKTFDKLLNGGLSVSLQGDVLTVAWAGTTGDPASTMDLTFQPATTAVPEPSSVWALVLAGVIGVGGRKFQKGFRNNTASS